MLANSPQEWDYHTLGHLPLLRRDRIWNLRDFRYVSNTASSNRLKYVWTTFPTQCPHCIALSFYDSTTLRTAQAALSVIMKEPVWLRQLKQGDDSPMQNYKEMSNYQQLDDKKMQLFIKFTCKARKTWHYQESNTKAILQHPRMHLALF